MKYAIQFRGFLQDPHRSMSWDYYTGAQYAVNHELYVIGERSISKAKLYSSKKRAENAMNSMCGKFANIAEARIVPNDQS